MAAFSLQPGLLNPPYSSTVIFDRLPIDKAKEEFRLWRFSKKPSTGEYLHIHMEVFPIHACPKYIALSYVWGIYHDARSVTINKCGSLAVTKDLWGFLSVLYREEIERKTNAWYWADQISIDQQVISERGHQVGLMGNIFSRARMVFAYLGPEPHSSIMSIQALQKLAPGDSSNGPNLRLPTENRFANIEEERYWLTMIYLLTREYWNRLWIVQELRLASDALFWCGPFVLDREALVGTLTWVESVQRQLLLTIKDSPHFERELFDTVNAFYVNFQWIKIMRLLSDKGVHESPKAWLEVLIQFGMNQCLDDRDKIFGLQAIVKPENRIGIDYTKTFGQLLREIIVRLLVDSLADFRWREYRGWSPVLKVLERIGAVTSALTGMACIDGVNMCWSYLAGRMARWYFESFSDRTNSYVYYLWEGAWKKLAHLAVTERQKNLTDALKANLKSIARACQGNQTFLPRPSLKDSLKHWAELPDDTDEFWTDVIENFYSTFSRHGFFMVGDFLCHPEDAIPFSQFDVAQSEYRNHARLPQNK